MIMKDNYVQTRYSWIRVLHEGKLTMWTLFFGSDQIDIGFIFFSVPVQFSMVAMIHLLFTWKVRLSWDLEESEIGIDN